VNQQNAQPQQAQQAKTTQSMATARPKTSPNPQNAGYSVNNGQYSYDSRYGSFNPKTDYTAMRQMAEKGGNYNAAAYAEAMANQKVQSTPELANNPKYSTSNKYGDYLGNLSPRYISYLQGNSKTAYDLSPEVQGWIGNYDKNYQYSDAIKKAAAEGNYTRAAVLEALMNQKIQKENLPYLQQDNYSSYLNGVTQSDINTAKYGVDVTPSGRYYKVENTGKAPKGLNVGDLVVTGGGTFMITGPWSDDKNDYTGVVKVDNGTTTQSFNGQYSIPGSVMQSLGLETQRPEERTYDFTAPDASTYQLNAVDPGNVDVTSTGQIPEMEDVFMPNRVTEEDLTNLLDQRYNIAQQQVADQIRYATETGIRDYKRAYEDALPTYAAQRSQADLEGDKNARNAALYAEQRGDRGGIGAAQYNALQIAKANQLNQINTAQNKLASDTARSIADLRAKGEFELADKMKDLAQQQLSQLMDMKQWIANYDVTLSQLYMQDRAQKREDMYNQMNVTGRTPDGGYTMPGNQANMAAKATLADLFGMYDGKTTVPFQAQNAQLGLQAAQTFGKDANGNITQSAQESLWNQPRYDSKETGYYMGRKNADTQAREADNYYKYFGTFQNNPYGLLKGIQTSDYTQQQYENNRNELNDARSWVLDQYQAGLPVGAEDFTAAGITDPTRQRVIQLVAQMIGAQALANGGADALLMYPGGYAGMLGSVTTGGGVGTSTGSGGGSGGGSGSSKSGSNPNPTPAADTKTPTPAKNVVPDAVSGAQPPSKTQDVTNKVNTLLKYT